MAGFDTIFHDPMTADPADYDFNRGANWIDGRVPDGTGFLTTRHGSRPVWFSQATTTLGAVSMTGALDVALAADRTLVLTGDGLYVETAGFGCSGTLRGDVVLRGRSREEIGVLGATNEAPAGTVEGNVHNISGLVNPGRVNDTGSGTMTIKGSFILGHPDDPQEPLPGRMQITLDPKGLSCLNVAGSANILANSDLQCVVQFLEPVLPWGKEFPILTTTEGLKGVFQRYHASPGRLTLRYDTKNVYATVTKE